MTETRETRERQETHERRDSPGDDHRARPDVALDLEVGLELEGYRWVEWNRRALAESPLHEPGRFVGHPGDLLSHLLIDAPEKTAPAPHPYGRLPHYSSEPAPALRAAERAGLFRDDGVRISCSHGGVWHLIDERAGIDLEDDCLPRLLCRAALRLVEVGPTEEDT